ncbi:MAG: polysaccharide biosynthesis protein [Clostridiales bacterium]|nr:polysaccharide biosynthesis protein [Clostridiales bacterium]
MKIQRTKNAARNITFDGLLKLLTIFSRFLIRSAILRWLGTEYLGLSGLFSSVFSILNLAELGVGSAIVFSMYRPIAEDDTQMICALLKLYRRICRCIGLFVALVGLALTPFLRVLVKGDVPPDIDLYVLYLLNLGSTVVTYWFFAYRGCVFMAHQRVDVTSRIMLCVSLAEYALKLAALMLLRSYYAYLIVHLTAQIATNIITAFFAGKMYPAYVPQGELSKDLFGRIARLVRDCFSSKFSHVINESADTLVISSFLGLKALAVYQNYNYVIIALRNFHEVVVHACTAGVGNSLVTESKEKNYRDLRRLTLLFGWFMGVTAAMLLCMYQPFMELWMGRENMLSDSYAMCFSLYYYTLGMNMLINMFKDAAGIWHRDRFRPLTAALVNLALNLATVRAWGLYGILLSTVVSIALVQVPWLFHNLFSEIFPREHLWEYVKEFCLLALLALLGCAASWLICSGFEAGIWIKLLTGAAVSFVVPNLLFFLCFGRSELFRSTVRQLFQTLKQSIGRNR